MAVGCHRTEIAFGMAAYGNRPVFFLLFADDYHKRRFLHFGFAYLLAYLFVAVVYAYAHVFSAEHGGNFFGIIRLYFSLMAV